MSRNAIEVYDPEAIQQKVQLEVRQKMAASGQQPQRIDPNAPIFRMFAEVAAKEAAKFREREEERRRRDPTYRPDAIDLNEANVRAFDEKVDYYQRLSLDQFSSALEVKRAYMRLSLQFHTDKQVGKADAEAKAALDRFKELTEAYEILSDMATRRQYDRARDKRDASREHFGRDHDTSDSPNPPTAVDVEVPLETLYRGSLHRVAFEQLVYDTFVRNEVTHKRNCARRRSSPEAVRSPPRSAVGRRRSHHEMFCPP